MNKNRTIVKNSLILYSKLIFTSIFGLVATRFILKNLGISDFGLYGVVGSIVVMMNFFNTVMVTTTYRYIAFEMGGNDSQNVKIVFNVSLAIHVVAGLVMLGMAFTVGNWYIKNYLTVEQNRIDDAILVFRWSLIAALFNVFSVPYQGVISATEKFSIIATIDICRSALSLFAAISLAIVETDKVVIYSAMIACISILTFFGFSFYCNRCHPNFVALCLVFDAKRYREMLSFSGWVVFGAAAHISKDTGSQLLLNLFFGTPVNAAFGVASRVNSFVGAFALNLAQAAVPQITKSYSSGDQNRVNDLVSYIGKYTFFLIYLCTFPLLIETPYFLGLWLDEVPEYTTVFCRLLLIDGLISAPMAGFPAAIQASGRIALFMISGSLITLSCLPLSYIMFNIGLPPYVILVGYLGTTVLYLALCTWLINKITNFDVWFFFKRNISKVLFVVGSSIPLVLLSDFIELYKTGVLFRLSLVLLMLILCIYLFGLENNEKVNFKLELINLFRLVTKKFKCGQIKYNEHK